MNEDLIPVFIMLGAQFVFWAFILTWQRIGFHTKDLEHRSYRERTNDKFI